ncbi:MAG: acyl-CoA dehydrogenase family protein [Alphaproteobacteria bacterium]
MGMVLNEEQTLLQDSARSFIEARAPLTSFRTLRDRAEPSRYDRAVWKQMADMGWAALRIPEDYGGLAFDFQGLGLILEQTGRNLTPSPLLSTAAVCAPAIAAGGSDAVRESVLPQVAAGQVLLALACDEGAHHAPDHVETRAVHGGDGFTLTGEKNFVVDGVGADYLIVSARTAGAAKDRYGITLFLVDAKASGVTLVPMATVDNRNAAKLVLDGVTVPFTHVIGAVDAGFSLLDQVLDLGRIAMAAEMLGSAQAAFDITLAYLKERTQFGQTIGQFQALQHRAAIMFSELEQLHSVVTEALSAVDEPGANVAQLASLAKAKANDVLHLVAREAIQMHGGIGMTDAHDIGFFLKRAAVAECLYGNTTFHRDRYATLSGF